MSHEKEDVIALKTAIGRSHFIVNGIVLTAFGSYILWFWILKGQGLSTSTETWGQLGDYVGGFLNPVVAYFAFYWLTRSVALQKEELADSRRALQESSVSQEKQAAAAKTSVRVAALTALINSVVGEVHVQRMQIQFLLDQASTHHSGAARAFDGRVVDSGELPKYLKDLNNRISERMTERDRYQEELKSILSDSRSAI